MGRAIAVRTDYTVGEVRGFARRAKDAAQARRLLAIAAVLEGASREDAARIGGMDRQTLRDWVKYGGMDVSDAKRHRRRLSSDGHTAGRQGRLHVPGSSAHA